MVLSVPLNAAIIGVPLKNYFECNALSLADAPDPTRI